MEIRLPELGEGIADATVVNVPVKAGEAVHAGDTIIEVETEKASMPIPAPVDGTVSELRVKRGDKIKVGAVIAVLGDQQVQTAETSAKQQQAASARNPRRPARRQEFKLPNLGEGIESGVIVAVNVKPGDVVSAGQELFTIETDKASMPLTADSGGRIEALRVKQGDKVNIGSTLAILSNVKGERPAPAAEPAAAATATKPKPAAAVSGDGKRFVPTFNGPVPAGPATRRYAREHGVDLIEVHGTRPRRPCDGRRC